MAASSSITTAASTAWTYDPSAKLTPDEKSSAERVDDLVNLTTLSANTIVHALKYRYERQKIYTNVHAILLAFNPYQQLSCYTNDELDLYSIHASPSTRSSLAPHVYAIARAAYEQSSGRNTTLPAQSQSILISGESGAGKTESTKHLLQYISYMSRHETSHNSTPTTPLIPSSSSSSPYNGTMNMKSTLKSTMSSSSAANGAMSPSSISAIESKLLLATPILESFGNSKTQRNDNSSRFGKWIQITMNQSGSGGISHAKILKYLLEESRVINRQAGERSFGIFYQILAYDRSLIQAASSNGTSASVNGKKIHATLSSPAAAASSLSGGKPSYFTYLFSQSECYTIQGIDDLTVYHEMSDSFSQLGMVTQQQSQLFDILRGILWLGQIEFQQSLDANHKGKDVSSIRTDTIIGLNQAAKFFGLPPAALQQALCIKVIVTGRNSMIRSERTVAQAYEIRDSISKYIYGKVFTFIVEYLNHSLSAEKRKQEMKNGVSAASAAGGKPVPEIGIGILDIFGFEIFEKNSFEQLCINYANEKLHQYFIQNLFKMEQQMLLDEGLILPSDYLMNVEYQDNILCIDLLDKRPSGVIWLLNDEVSIPKGTDMGFIEKCVRIHGTGESDVNKRSKYFLKPKPTSDVNSPYQFTILHYASPVQYSALDFLDKNRSKLNEDVIEMIAGSSRDMMKAVFEVVSEDEITQQTAQTQSNGRRGTQAQGSPEIAPSNRRSSVGANIPSSSSFSKPTSLAAQFHSSLSSLLTTINSTTSHFIRCIKPNSLKSPHMKDFHVDMVVAQLRNNGIMDVVRLRQEQLMREKKGGGGGGYTKKWEHVVFIQRYCCIVYHENVVRRKKGSKQGMSKVRRFSSMASEVNNSIQGIVKMIQSIVPTPTTPTSSSATPLPPYQIGRTRVFLTTQCWRVCESVRHTLVTTAATRIQALARGHSARKKTRARMDVLLAVRKAVLQQDLNALNTALDLALACGLPRHATSVAEQVRAKLTCGVRAREMLQVALQEQKSPISLQARLAALEAAQDAAREAGLIDKTNKLLLSAPSPKSSSATQLLHAQLTFLLAYTSLVKVVLKELDAILLQCTTDRTAVPKLGTLLNDLPTRFSNSIPATTTPGSLSITQQAFTQLRTGIAECTEIVESKKKWKGMQDVSTALDQANAAMSSSSPPIVAMSPSPSSPRASSASPSTTTPSLSSLNTLAQDLGLTWSDLNSALLREEASQLENLVMSALSEFSPSALKLAQSKLSSVASNPPHACELDSKFSSPQVDISSLQKLIKLALEQYKAEVAIEERIKHAMTKGDINEIREVLEKAEQVVNQRTKIGVLNLKVSGQIPSAIVTSSSPSPAPIAGSVLQPNPNRVNALPPIQPGLSSSQPAAAGGLSSPSPMSPLSSPHTPHTPNGGTPSTPRHVSLDNLMQSALLNLRTLQARKEACEKLKQLGKAFEKDDVVTIRTTLHTALSCGVSSLDTTPVQRRLCEIETRLGLVHGMETRDISALELAIEHALKRKENNEIEIVTNKFADTMNAAKHCLQLYKGLAVLRASYRSLLYAREKKDTPQRIAEAEEILRECYSNAIILGARDSDLAEYQEVITPLRQKAKKSALSKQDLMTNSDLIAQQTAKHYEEVRKRAIEQDEEKVQIRKMRREQAGTPTSQVESPSNLQQVVNVMNVKDKNASANGNGKQKEVHEEKKMNSGNGSNSSSGSNSKDTKAPLKPIPSAVSANGNGKSHGKVLPQLKISSGKDKSSSSSSSLSSQLKSEYIPPTSPPMPALPKKATSSAKKNRPSKQQLVFSPTKKTNPLGEGVKQESLQPNHKEKDDTVGPLRQRVSQRPIVRYPTLDDPILEEQQREQQRRISKLQREQAQQRLEAERREQEESERREGEMNGESGKLKSNEWSDREPLPNFSPRAQAKSVSGSKGRVSVVTASPQQAAPRRTLSPIAFVMNAVGGEKSTTTSNTGLYTNTTTPVSNTRTVAPSPVRSNQNRNGIAFVLSADDLPPEQRNRSGSAITSGGKKGETHRWSVNLDQLEEPTKREEREKQKQDMDSQKQGEGSVCKCTIQ